MTEIPLWQDLLERLALTRRTSDALRARYAPSPTGPLHLGNVRTALVAWLHARLSGATLILRMEDLDEPRALPGSADSILDDLRWLGLTWDEGPDVGGPCGPYTQSERKALYESALADLQAQGLVYPCRCSRKEILAASSAPHGASPVYPGTCRRASDRTSDRAPALRLIVAADRVAFEDGLRGEYGQQLDVEVGDFVIKRAEGLFAYQLAVVVDDLLMGITHVVRGEDLLDSTPRQLALLARLRGQAPSYWHVPLLRDAQGHKLSKRDGATGVGALRARGVSGPQLVGALAASLGLWPSDAGACALDELLDALGSVEALRARLALQINTPLIL